LSILYGLYSFILNKGFVYSVETWNLRIAWFLNKLRGIYFEGRIYVLIPPRVLVCPVEGRKASDFKLFIGYGVWYIISVLLYRIYS